MHKHPFIDEYVQVLFSCRLSLKNSPQNVIPHDQNVTSNINMLPYHRQMHDCPPTILGGATFKLLYPISAVPTNKLITLYNYLFMCQ